MENAPCKHHNPSIHFGAVCVHECEIRKTGLASPQTLILKP
jgi:hypothetical protein